MDDRDDATPQPDPAAHPWTTAAELAARLGITPTTLRRHVRNPATASWLPRPQQIAGRYVWATAELEGIEQRERPRPGNPNWTRTHTGAPAVPPGPAAS